MSSTFPGIRKCDHMRVIQCHIRSFRMDSVSLVVG
ncbi:MAG: hypothetical protein A4E69_02794 [Syntrophus sp. PtaB.Bin138]|nr:MAG: hypothetical protein A4E69_02794 [Syntrophus sp. PtaB.Bin138]